MTSGKTSWRQFTLRAFCVFVTAVCLALAAGARHLHTIAREQQAVRAILAYGGDVGLEVPAGQPPSGPDSEPGRLLEQPAWKLAFTGRPQAIRAWLLVDQDQDQILGELTALGALRELSLSGALEDAPAAALRHLYALEELQIASSSLSAAAIESVLPRQLKKLKLSEVDLGALEGREVSWPRGLAELDVQGCSRLTGRVLGKLLHPELEKLSVNGADLTDQDLATVVAPDSLRSLDVRRAGSLSAAGLNRLLGRSLEALRLDSPNVTDADIEVLRLPTNLHWLDLTGCDQLTNRSVELIVHRCPGIEWLTLSGDHIDGGCIPALNALPAGYLDLRRTSITREALAPLASGRSIHSRIICKGGEFWGARFVPQAEVERAMLE
ncbi:MAG: hypothetical protein U0836_03650 [Pirellulales bacterium]